MKVSNELKNNARNLREIGSLKVCTYYDLRKLIGILLCSRRVRMVANIILEQFNKVRSWSIEEAENLSEIIVNVQPEGFNNTIKWHLGHIITETEYFLFELTSLGVMLPNTYNDFFAPGTKPREWKGEAPPLSELVSSLKSQEERVNEISEETLNHMLEKPMHGFNTVEDSASFSVLHESLHLGQLLSMKRVIMNSQK